MKKLAKLLNQRGSMAITMVMGTVLIVTPLVVMFTSDLFVNKLKVYNIQDRFRARLTAESGLKFAMARLRLYKEAYNFLQKNTKAKDVVKQETLDMIWNFPFIFPIPSTGEMNQIQKDAISGFNEKTSLEGTLQLTIQNISNKINLNLLRISLLFDAQEEARKNAQKNGNRTGDDDDDDDDDNEEFNPETQLFKILTDAIMRESEDDDYFNGLYYGMEVQPLVNELKYFVSDPGSIEDPAGGDARFYELELTPKRGPLISFSEVYSLPSWPDDIINLIANEFTVHGAIMIDLNRITDKLLRVLIPNIQDEEVTEFFKYKDDPEDPKYFNSRADFKNYIVKIANIMTESKFDERFNKFEAQGLRFGPTPTLFKVISNGKVGRSEYNLTGYVIIPAQPRPRPKTKPGEGEGQQPAPINPNTNSNNGRAGNGGNRPSAGQGTNGEKDKKQKTLLLEPRLVEIIIN